MVALQKLFTLIAVAWLALVPTGDFDHREHRDVTLIEVSAAPTTTPSGAIVSRGSTLLEHQRLEKCRVDTTLPAVIGASANQFSSGTLDEIGFENITPSCGQLCFWTLRLTI